MNRISLISFLFFLFVHGTISSQEKTTLIIDADTGNEVDDLYAIVRGLIEPSFKVVGLSSAQWQASHWTVPNSLENSHRLNLEILSYMQMEDIPHPRGAADRLYDWGDDIAQHSAAAYHIITEAHKMPSGMKLTIAVLGASTNLASALLIDPSIAGKIRVYLVGTSFDLERMVWEKRDFNCMMDLHALDVIMDAHDLETHIMPVNVLSSLSFNIHETGEMFIGKHPLLDFLYLRWVNHIGGSKYARIVWDLSVIECLIHPELGTEMLVDTPPDNHPRKIYVYTSINADEMKKDFFKSVSEYFSQGNSPGE